MERFEIRKTRLPFRKQKYWVATIGANNRILQKSEMLTHVEDCYTNIEAVCSVADKHQIFEKFD